MSEVIADSAALAHALARLAHAPWLALDTEFMRERTYYPQLCLIQLGALQDSVLIDPLAIDDLSPLAEFLAVPTRGLLVHAARQDLEALARRGIAPTGPLFDTQIAAMLLGHSEQASYAALVAHFCAVTLDKSQTRTDWSQRPLSPAQLDYAAEDVRYLPTLHAQLETDLRAADKLPWLWEETTALVAATRQGDAPDEAWRRVKGLDALPALSAARVRALALWREELAQARDVPRGWILKDEVMFALVRAAPTSATQLAAVPGLPPATLRKHGSALLACLAASPEAFAQPEVAAWRLSRPGQTLLGELQTLVRETGERLSITPTFMANRRELERLILGESPGRLSAGWRAELLGEMLSARVAAVPLAERRLRV